MELNLPTRRVGSQVGDIAPVVPGRSCEGCNVCCTELTIQDPELKKLQGTPCVHNRVDKLCGVYEARPQTCREFQCGWKVLRWAPAGFRPDRSEVMIQPRRDADGRQAGVVALMLSPRALKAEGLAEFLAAAVEAGVPLELGVPGPPGYASAHSGLNAALEAPVAARDKPALLREVRRLYSHLRTVKRARLHLG